MEKDKFQNTSGSLLPPWRNNFGYRGEPSGSTTLPHMGPETSRFGGHEIQSGSNSSHFSHDISRMPDNPPKNLGHRRAQSEILTLPDDISFDSDLGVVGGPDETEEDMFAMYLDLDKFNSSSATSVSDVHAHTSDAATTQSENFVHSSADRLRVRHHHSQSMDGSSTIEPEMLASAAADAKKSLAAAKLAELALVDPKRAKRIWANRQSAARSKERKMRYIGELERKVQTLQTEATSLAAQLTLMQRDTNGLTAENSELKLRLQTMEQQVHLQDALNEALKEEIQHLKVVTGQNPFGSKQQQFYSNSQQAMLTAHQFQQLQIQQHKQFQQFQQQSP